MNIIDLYPGEKLPYFEQRSSHELLHPAHISRICDSSGARLFTVEGGSILAWKTKILIYDKNDNLIPEISFGSDAVGEDLPDEFEEIDIDSDVLYSPSLQPDGYYHWVTENLPALGLIEDFDIKISHDYFWYMHRLKAGFQREYFKKIDISTDRILSYEIQEDSKLKRKPICIHAQRLIVPQFRRVNGAGWPNRKVLSKLRQQYRGPTEKHTIWEDSGNVTRMLYVKRGNDARRCVTNEGELLRVLEDKGFTCVVMEGKSIEEQAHIFRDAHYIIGPHGAGLANMVFTKKGAKVMEYCGGYVSNSYRSLSLLCGHSYHVVSAGLDSNGNAIPVEFQRERRIGSFSVDIRKIVQEVDNVWKIEELAPA